MRVLICADEPVFAHGLAQLLREHASDFETVGVATSLTSLDEQLAPLSPDVVLLAANLLARSENDLGGQRVVAALAKVVVLTDPDSEEDLLSAVRAGAIGCVPRDRDLPEILEVMRAVARGYYVVPAEQARRMLETFRRSGDGVLGGAELDILRAIASGDTNRQVGLRLGMSERTVRRRLEGIRAKLHLADRVEAVLYARRQGRGS